MIFNTMSGGAGLNFKVVGGTTQPTNPKENTIWINTDAEIAGWALSADAPTDPAEGMVWIKNGTLSGSVFNALKKENLLVYPLYASQYISGAWIKKEAYIYQAEEWKPFNTYVFYNGTLLEGYELKGSYNSEDAVTYDAPKISNGKITYSKSGRSGFYINPQFNVSEYTKLRIVYTLSMSGTSTWASCGIATTNRWGQATAGMTAAANMTYDGTQKTMELDISNVTGNFYILFRFYTQASMSLTIDSITFL